MTNPIDVQLRTKKSSLLDFFETATNVLSYLSFSTTDSLYTGDYRISKQKIEGSEKYLRPINQRLFISDHKEFRDKFCYSWIS